MRIFALLALAALVLFASAEPSAARKHARMYCWALDSEFPVPCDDEGEEDDGGGELRFQGLGFRFLGNARVPPLKPALP